MILPLSVDVDLTKLVDQSLVTVQGPDRYRLESARTNAQRERHLRNRGMMRERNAEPELIQPGKPREAEPVEGTMKDLPIPTKDAPLFETDDPNPGIMGLGFYTNLEHTSGNLPRTNL